MKACKPKFHYCIKSLCEGDAALEQLAGGGRRGGEALDVVLGQPLVAHRPDEVVGRVQLPLQPLDGLVPPPRLLPVLRLLRVQAVLQRAVPEVGEY